MKKILQITNSLARHGTETFIVNVLKHINLADFQFDFLLFTPEMSGDYTEIVKQLGSQVYYASSRSMGFKTYCKVLDDFFRKHSKEYIAVHFSGCTMSTLMPLYYAKKYSIPIRIIHAHSSSYSGIHNYILHEFNKFRLGTLATHALACSVEAAEWFFSKTRFEKNNIIIRNGIQYEDFIFSNEIRQSIRRKFNIDNSTFVLGHVGYFMPVKNHTFLLDVFYEFNKRYDSTKLLLIGEGKLKDEISEKVRKLNIEHKVLFLGNRSDVNQLLQAFDCFVFPSLYEGLPFSIIEAQVAGLPIFASDRISKETQISNNIEYIDINKSSQYWAEKILSVANVSQDRFFDVKKYSYFSIDHTVRQLTDIYNS
ncbi:MAG TPA: glycosyltransferase family 1 protein [Lachnospiraceae bacterium]|nr:glycosyltransferase family 1 protein [Lachnospiraceae bacterium]